MLNYNIIYTIENITEDEELRYIRNVVLESENDKLYILRDIHENTVIFLLKKEFSKNFKILATQIPNYPITVTNTYFVTTTT